MLQPWDFVLLALAAYYLHACWLRGGIFAVVRARLQARQGALFPDMLTCPLCLAWVIAAAVLMVDWLDRYVQTKWTLAIFALAGAITLAWDYWVRRDD